MNHNWMNFVLFLWLLLTDGYLRLEWNSSIRVFLPESRQHWQQSFVRHSCPKKHWTPKAQDFSQSGLTSFFLVVTQLGPRGRGGLSTLRRRWGKHRILAFGFQKHDQREQEGAAFQSKSETGNSPLIIITPMCPTWKTQRGINHCLRQ